MAIERLLIRQLRNLDAVDLKLGRRVNFFYGANGSGKTSILEALSLLSHGRSFRSHLIRPVIQHEAGGLTVFAQVREQDRVVPFGIERTKTKPPLIKVEGNPVRSIAEMASRLPLLVLDGHSFQLLEGGPKERRQLLDWMVFHVKPEFLEHWRRYQRVLKQRNSMLRHGRIRASELAVWDREIAQYADMIHLARQECFDLFAQALAGLLGQGGYSDRIPGVGVSYSRGWPDDMTLVESLQESLERDIKAGYSHVGPHRADIKITVNGFKAVEVLSRGQQKIVVSAMKLAQADVVKETVQRTCTFLVDDLPAELDLYHQQQLAQWLLQLDAQVFVTGVDKNELLQAWPAFSDETFRVFHVEHGRANSVAAGG